MRFTIIALVACLASPAVAQDIAAGKRITVNSDWHAQNGGPYSPRIVSCDSNSGLCLKDTNLNPPLTPMTKTGAGLQVVFSQFNVVYMFRSGGKGTFHDMSGKQTGRFTWTQ